MDLRVGDKMFKYFKKLLMGFVVFIHFSPFNQVYHII